MEQHAVAKSVRVSPRKVRLLAKNLSGMRASEALLLLTLIRKRAKTPIEKTIKSALANAVHNARLNSENLIVREILVSEGPSLKRYHPTSRGRVHPYKRRSSHIRVVVEEVKSDGAKS